MDKSSSSSKPSVKNNLGFLMRVKPASLLKKAVSSLSDKAFNPEMFGMIEVGVPGFQITVHSKKEGAEDVLGVLSLKAEFLDEFVCEKTMRRMVSLHGIKTILNGVDEKDDIVTVFHINGTNLLSFGFGTPDSENPHGTPFALHIDLLEDVPQYQKFPDVASGFAAVIKSKDFIPMCEQVLAQPADRHCKLVTLTMDTSVQLNAENCTTVTAAPQRRHAWMKWPYWESLQKALSAGQDCHLSFVTEPNDRIMLRFQLPGVGDLVFLINNVTFRFDSTLATLTDFTSLL